MTTELVSTEPATGKAKSGAEHRAMSMTRSNAHARRCGNGRANRSAAGSNSCAASPTKSASTAMPSPNLIARETGKPVGSADRSRSGDRQGRDFDHCLCRAQWAEEAQQRAAGHCGSASQAAWRDGGAGAAQLPRAPAQRPHRTRADRGQCGDLQAERENPGSGRIPDPLLPRGESARRRRPVHPWRGRGRPGGRALDGRWRAVHGIGARGDRDQPQAGFRPGQDRGARNGRKQPDRHARYAQDRGRGGDHRAVRLHHCRPALHRSAAG